MKKNTFQKALFLGMMCGALWVPNIGYAHPGSPFLGIKLGISPLFSVDYGRSITGIIQGVINLCADGEQKAQLIATQEETNQQADGTADSSENAASQAGSSTSSSGTSGEGGELTGNAFDYVSKKVFNNGTPYRYDLLKETLGSSPSKEQAKEAVLNTFFADSKIEKQRTKAYKEKIYNQRQEYAEIVTDFHLNLANGVRKTVIKDLAAAGSAPVSSDNEVSYLLIDALTLDEMIKSTLVDLALQIELMEADAMTFMLHQPIELISNPIKPLE